MREREGEEGVRERERERHLGWGGWGDDRGGGRVMEKLWCTTIRYSIHVQLVSLKSLFGSFFMVSIKH